MAEKKEKKGRSKDEPSEPEKFEMTKGKLEFKSRCLHDGKEYKAGDECKLSGDSLEKLCRHGVVGPAK